jgi:hypothetical protein
MGLCSLKIRSMVSGDQSLSSGSSSASSSMCKMHSLSGSGVRGFRFGVSGAVYYSSSVSDASSLESSGSLMSESSSVISDASDLASLAPLLPCCEGFSRRLTVVERTLLVTK